MSRGKKLITAIVLTLIGCASARAANLPDSVRAVKVSGGEEHTVVLTAAKAVWGCGKNSDYQLGIGSSSTQSQYTLAQVFKGDMNCPSLYLEDITAIDAGWSHSLTLDVNAWLWGK
ncbi:MAG: hypothetical protein ACYST6_21020 [Planctomycetota bacterium]|jgi:alpha-tubulin suppressor-like RCC1 family protein